MKSVALSGMLPGIVSGMMTQFSLFMNLLINSLLRYVGHIVNLAQQAFICALMGGEFGDNRLEGPGVDSLGVGDHSGDEDEPDLSGLESSTGWYKIMIIEPFRTQGTIPPTVP